MSSRPSSRIKDKLINQFSYSRNSGFSSSSRERSSTPKVLAEIPPRIHTRINREYNKVSPLKRKQRMQELRLGKADPSRTSSAFKQNKENQGFQHPNLKTFYQKSRSLRPRNHSVTDEKFAGLEKFVEMVEYQKIREKINQLSRGRLSKGYFPFK